MKKFITAIIIILLFGWKLHSQEWSNVDNTGTSFILYGMSFPPGQSTIGFACGMEYTYDADGVIIKTTDGGDNWTQVWPVSGSIDGLQGIWFINNTTGFACGWNNYFIKTTDGGETWTTITVGSNVWYYVDVVFRDDENGVAAATMNNPGDQAVFVTDDGGDTWTPATSGVGTNEIMGLAYADQNTVFAVGTGSHVFRSTDGGHNWTTYSTLSALLFGVDFADSDFGVVGAEEEMYATDNGGSSWTNYVTGYEHFYATKAFSNGTAYYGGTDENIYITMDYGETWSMDYNGPGSSTLYRIRFTDDGTGFACGSQGRIIKREVPLSADFTAVPTTVCTNSTVDFYDNSIGDIETWSWTFEGGTPPTSSEENPTVTYSDPGTYDVELTVTAGGNSSTETKTDYIAVFQLADPPVTPTGTTETCGGGTYEYTTQNVPYAQSYDWQVVPEDAGNIEGSDTIASFTASGTWTGDYTVKVRAENVCGYSLWSEELTATLHSSPAIYHLDGEGAYCEGDPGAELTLDNSETGVSYELYIDNVPTGVIAEGTGSEISFGYLEETGLYTAVGFTDYCSENMTGQVYVHLESLPGQSGIPEGPESVCDDQSTEYTTTGASDADDYLWILNPEEAGALTGNEEEATVAWNPGFTGSAWLSVYGINDCGAGPVSDSLEIAVNASPEPEVSGPDLVCNNMEGQYSTGDNPGSEYNWEATNGTITSGSGTWQVTVLWGDPGPGSVLVTELTSEGCEASSDTLYVTVDDCTGILESKLSEVTIYPNPAKDKIFLTGVTKADIQVFDLLGNEILFASQVSGNQSLDISTLTKGIYMIRVRNSTGSKTFRLVKM